MAFQNVKITVGGPTIILHSAATADPLNPYAKALKAISGKRKKVEADFEQMARIEYEAGLYLNRDKEVVIPGHVIEATIVGGAKKSKEGKVASPSVYVESDGTFEYAGGPLSLEELIESPEHRLCVGVKVGQSRVMRTRPFFRDWKLTFTVELNTELADVQQLRTWVTKAGAEVGMCDWRPRHGRFNVLDFEVV